MKHHLKILIPSAVFAVVSVYSASVYALPDVSLSPVLVPLNADQLEQEVTFTIKNLTDNDRVSLNTPTFVGDNLNEFSIGANDCMPSIADGENCSLSVNYAPNNGIAGARSVMLTLPDTNGTVLAAALLTTQEGKVSEAARRIPDILTAISIKQNNVEVSTLQSGVETTISWGQTGYQSGVDSVLAIFECEQSTLDSDYCGASFNTNTQHSNYQTTISSGAGDWTYEGVISNVNNYRWTFTPECAGNALVLRLYHRSKLDGSAGNKSLSLLVPGGLLADSQYYDQEGRRLSVPCVTS